MHSDCSTSWVHIFTVSQSRGVPAFLSLFVMIWHPKSLWLQCPLTLPVPNHHFMHPRRRVSALTCHISEGGCPPLNNPQRRRTHWNTQTGVCRPQKALCKGFIIVWILISAYENNARGSFKYHISMWTNKLCKNKKKVFEALQHCQWVWCRKCWICVVVTWEGMFCWTLRAKNTMHPGFIDTIWSYLKYLWLKFEGLMWKDGTKSVDHE